MPEIGQTISHYRIVNKIGQGGMGEVYLADDTTLDRKVALKFLSEAFTSDPERMARFEREAKLLASLNHSNIAGIYGLEQADGSRFLVLEYVEGETLQARLSKGALPLEDALELCRQIAEGLEAAHEKGVIHRDLKPTNVMITAEEKVKILDFGLAKAFADGTQSIDSSQSPTITEAMTRPGVILGTAAYMPPEQAKGKPVDNRADIWAFGVVLFEMLTGRRLFTGETGSDILAAVIKSELEWDSLPPNLHPRIRLMLERCLEKDPKKRYSGINDALVDIEKVLADPGGMYAQPIAAVESKMKSWPMLLWASTTVILIIIVGTTVWILRTSESREKFQFTHHLLEDQQFFNLYFPCLAISSNGRQFVYSTNRGLFLHSIAESESDVKCISNPDEGTSNPTFSPDGKYVVYWSRSDNKLKKVSIMGETPEPLCDVTSNVLGISWSAEDKIVYSEQGTGIWQVSPNSHKKYLLKPEKEKAFYHPQLLPDEVIMYTQGINELPYEIVVQSLKSDKQISFHGDCAKYFPSGHIFYARENELYVISFDLNTFELTENRERIFIGLYRNGKLFPPQYAISESKSGLKSLVYLPGAKTETRNLVLVDKDGIVQPLKFDPKAYSNPKFSTDGNQVAVVIRQDDIDKIHIGNIASGNMIELNKNEQAEQSPLWTINPRDQEIFFAWLFPDLGGFKIYKKATSGTDEPTRVSSQSEPYNYWPVSWADDGKTLILVYQDNGYDIGKLSLKGDGRIEPLLFTKNIEASPAISPTGQCIAYASDESGGDRMQVWMRPYPDVNKAWDKVANISGDSPLWSPDGKELFFLNGDSVMAISVNSDCSFNQDTLEPLFPDSFVSADFALGGGLDLHPWDISFDGKQFLMMKAVESPVSSVADLPKINVISNWLEETNVVD